MFKFSTSFSTLALLSLALAAPIKHKRFDYTSPAIDVTTFAADSSIDVAAIYSAAKAATSQELASYSTGKKTTSHIYGDWMKLDGVSAIHFMADMDVDCDGVAVSRHCASYILKLTHVFFLTVQMPSMSRQ